LEKNHKKHSGNLKNGTAIATGCITGDLLNLDLTPIIRFGLEINTLGFLCGQCHGDKTLTVFLKRRSRVI